MLNFKGSIATYLFGHDKYLIGFFPRNETLLTTIIANFVTHSRELQRYKNDT